jgi:hypothetical protein
LRSKHYLILVSVIALSAIMLISAAYLYTLSFSMTANVAEAGTVTVTIDSTTYNSGDSLNLAWGTVVPGQQYTKAITINNNVNNAVTPSIVATGLPSGWTLTLSDTSAIAAKGTATRNVTLSVPSNAVSGSSSWTASLTVSS